TLFATIERLLSSGRSLRGLECLPGGEMLVARNGSGLGGVARCQALREAKCTDPAGGPVGRGGSDVSGKMASGQRCLEGPVCYSREILDAKQERERPRPPL